jgi:MraZ protein
MVLTGTFVRTVDDKLRIAIPKRLREALGADHQLHLYVAPGTDGSLALYTEAALAALAMRLSAASPAQDDVRAFSRLFYARAERVEADAQGRIRLPAALAELAALGREVVLLGVHDHLELWDRGRWEAYVASRSAHYDQIAETAFQTPKT